MTPKEIMERASELYTSVNTTMSLSGARQAAATAASLLYYLAKLHLPEDEQKKVKKLAKLKVKKRKDEFEF
ncbi:MAG TPA: hypothetical protein VFY83_17170 [Anaerolineales bacterium]|nr:hypothetical protein [Anaerolineales bacterium]